MTPLYTPEGFYTPKGKALRESLMTFLRQWFNEPEVSVNDLELMALHMGSAGATNERYYRQNPMLRPVPPAPLVGVEDTQE